jgi:hypothetical protein
MDPLAKAFMTRVKAGLSKARDLSGLADWMVENTRHPKDNAKQWSFQDHEFQIGILSDPSNDLVVKKCAQRGLSEICVRMALGLIDIYQHSTAIYTLPTATDASLFAKGRFDPVINNSPELLARVDKDVDNTSMKKIGDSHLYIRGTFTQKAAISIPADILIHDEVDFSDPMTLTSFTSRLGHVKEEDIIKRRFSTPTVSGYGVSGLFDESTQCWRAAKCDHCGTWQIPKFLDDVVIPGFDGGVSNLEKDDLTDARFKINEAYISCPNCKGELTVANLADPEKREWVAGYPSATRAGYQVQSFDAPTIGPIPRTIRALSDYERKADWVNFAVGQDFQDAETSFVKEAVIASHNMEWVQPRINAAQGTVVGVDVGKTSWILVAKANSSGGLDVLHYERIKLQGTETLPGRVLELFTWYGAQRCVIDAGPEWTQALAVIEKLPAGKAFACYYKMPAKPMMAFVDVDEDTHVVMADRTAIISDMAKKVNSGQMRFCRCPDQQTMIDHLDVIKRVRRRNAKGAEVDMWINSGNRPDHYGHALFFASIANNLLHYSPKVDVVPTLPLAGKVRIGGSTTSRDDRRSYLDRK